MNVIKITEENINDYAEFTGLDVAENIARRSVRGIAVCDEDGTAPGGT